MYEVFEQLLQKYGITAYKVSKDTGITQSTLSDWKRGRSTPKTDNMKKIADYFGVSVEYLMTGIEEPKEKEITLTPKDERDIAKDLNSIMEKLRNGENGPASFDGAEIPEETQELFAQQLDIMLHHLKKINKEKYNPYKNKK
ncbi:helix-turn-helix domain-containing protein [[Clostridium] symbiosum]|uniref:helix-turn-helix domain-containing protein n=1 Tax=Clostridium symbiosum TaxID=1512 RepID=UPI000C2F8868|nr:helix-turn-helix transcriptional regulator [[Clostridium] symbiosum]PKB55007.1 transcriptional regulator [Clostridium sp. HMb25]DAZ16502.1 MAG TPA: Repressor protein CI [Caudoviricetes sp.]